MKINPIQFNFIQTRPQKAVNCFLRENNLLSCDTVSFVGASKKENKPKGLGDLVPKHKGIVYKKVKDDKGNIIKVPHEVDIVKPFDGTFDFVDGNNVVGFVSLSYIPKNECIDEIKNYYNIDCFYKNYKDSGIYGDRVKVNFVENCDAENYGGIGHLADLIEVACCKELGFEPNVISSSYTAVAPLHYLRGKRFIPYEQYCCEKQMDQYILKGKNPNGTIRDIIVNTPDGEVFDTSEMVMDPMMYMPKSMAKELEEELKEHPIF